MRVHVSMEDGAYPSNFQMAHMNKMNTSSTDKTISNELKTQNIIY